MSLNDLKDEYLDVSENLRHYGNARFALMTLFLAITAGILSIVFEHNQSQYKPLAIIVLKVVGIISSVAFWTMEERASQYYRRFRQRAVELEKDLEFKQYTNCPKQGVFSATNAVRLIYYAAILFWIVSLFV
jgi:dipeptide/tripeptide permease